MSEEKNTSNPSSKGDLVLREVWRAKDTLSAAYGHDLDLLFAESRAREKHSGHKVVNLSKSSAKANPSAT
jgi:hypothetical protein